MVVFIESSKQDRTIIVRSLDFSGDRYHPLAEPGHARPPNMDDELMQRFTISLDDSLAADFDQLVAARGYENRSEAVRDLIRERLGHQLLDASQAKWCVATATYVYSHHEGAVTARILDLQHDNHDLVVSSLRTYLDHDNCMEVMILRGATQAVQDCASQLIALRGVRHGRVEILPLVRVEGPHRHSRGGPQPHSHLKPAN